MKILKYVFFLFFIITFDYFAQSNSDSKVLSSETGSFVLGQISNYRSDQFLLDTETGRVWQRVLTADSQTVFQPVLFKSLNGKSTIIPEDPKIQWEDLKKSWETINPKHNRNSQN